MIAKIGGAHLQRYKNPPPESLIPYLPKYEFINGIFEAIRKLNFAIKGVPATPTYKLLQKIKQRAAYGRFMKHCRPKYTS